MSYRGGVETYLFSLFPLLERKGVSSLMAYAEGDESLHAPSRCINSIGSVGRSAERRARRRTQDILDREEPDLVHVHNVQNLGPLQASLGSVPTVLTTHDYRWVCPANSFFYRRTQEVCDRSCGPGCFANSVVKKCVTLRPQYGPYFYRRARWAVDHAKDFTTVIAPSEGCRTKHRESGFGDADLEVVPYPCEYTPLEEPRDPPESPTITYIGRIAPNKGYEYFVRALGRLSKTVRGVMVGVNSEEVAREVEGLARRHRCADRLEMRGWASREEIVDILRNTSVLLFPSLWPETLGIVGLEALSQGVPVVASNLGGVEEWCKDGDSGYLVEPKNAVEIAARVRDIISDEERMSRFGQKGIELVREKFSPATHADRMVGIYRQALS